MFRRILFALGYEQRSYDPRFAPGSWNTATHPARAMVSPQSVLSNLATAHRCIELKATLLSSVPLKTFRRLEDGGRERVSNTALARVLNRPNDWMTRFEFVELLSRSLDLHGNFFAQIMRDGGGSIRALIPLDARSITIERTNSGRIRYKFQATGNSVTLLDSEVLHVKNQSADGLQGQAPITTAARALGLAIDESATAQSLAANGLKPSFALTHPGKLSARAQSNIATSFEERNAGPHNAGRPLVLEEGLSVERMSFSAVDAQFLESRRLSAEDVCRIFGLPPQAVGLTNSVSYGSAAQAAQDLVTNTLNPLAARIEQALERSLLSEEGRREFFVEFDLSGLLRADPTARWQQYRVAREVGAMSPNDIRRLENMPPIVDGDEYTRPLNAAPLGFNPQQGSE